jgi:hypothetical protein
MTSTSVATMAARAGGTVARRVRSTVDRSGTQRAESAAPSSGWLGVTVLRQPDELDSARPPAPLAELGDRVEVRVRPAPGGKGTQLEARLREGGTSESGPRRLSGKDSHADLRSALRRAKQLIEVGEVLAVDPTPHGRRTPTPGGAFLEEWTKVAPGGGVR